MLKLAFKILRLEFGWTLPLGSLFHDENVVGDDGRQQQHRDWNETPDQQLQSAEAVVLLLLAVVY